MDASRLSRLQQCVERLRATSRNVISMMANLRGRKVSQEPMALELLDEEARQEAKQHVTIKGVEYGSDQSHVIISSDEETMEDTAAEEEEQPEIDPVVQDDIERFEESFRGISKRYRLIDRIGEGTFSTVYKAEDLCYDEHENTWDTQTMEEEGNPWSPRRRRTSTRFVAIKKIYVTSSPQRVQNELELLHDLKDCECVCPLITAFRHQDQIVAVLPYYEHNDFRDFFREMVPYDIQVYFRELFTGLRWVHDREILHRDIKPTNFLFNTYTQRGVLVDFGLAEREGTDAGHCLCEFSDDRRQRKLGESYVAKHGVAKGYPKEDTRPSRRANRAGTRGFRAPEVLFKCPKQTTKIDMWSAGVILLTILSQRFPFFNSTDDVDAMLELVAVFGQRRIKAAGYLHGAVLECNIPNASNNGYAFTKLIAWSTCKTVADVTEEERIIHKLLEGLLDLDHRKRMSADEALEHDFFQMSFPEVNDPDDEMVEMDAE